jgi:DNA-binding response OmpR family regulator
VEQTKNTSPLKRVLCVEDDRDTCDVLRFIMTEYDFSTVHSVEDALEHVGVEKYDLWVLDNWLPDGSGVELCERIRNSGDGSPIIFTSAVGQRQDIDRALEAGATHYIVKPYEPETLLKAVKELLEQTV